MTPHLYNLRDRVLIKTAIGTEKKANQLKTFHIIANLLRQLNKFTENKSKLLLKNYTSISLMK